MVLVKADIVNIYSFKIKEDAFNFGFWDKSSTVHFIDDQENLIDDEISSP